MITQINKLVNKFIEEGQVRLLPWLVQTSSFIFIFLLLAFLILDVVAEQRTYIKYPLFLLFVVFFVKKDIQNYWQIRYLQHMNDEIKNINKITEALRSTTNLDDVLEMILGNLTKELKYERAFIFLMNKMKNKEFLKGETGIGVLNEMLREQVIPLEESLGIIPKTAIQKRSFIIKDAKNDYSCEQKLVELLNLKEFATLPLIARDRVLGVLVIVADGYTKSEITEHDISLLDIFANQSAIAIQNARFYESIEKLSITDGLTGLYNHRFFQEKLKTDFARVLENNSHISLIYFDIDNFKYCNDTFGHLVGDKILHDIGGILNTIFDDSAVPSRYGGEEFTVILPEVSKEEAYKLAEKIRTTVEKYNFEYKKELPNEKLTVSLGVSSFPEDAKSYKELIEVADKRLYVAKKRGKNRTCIQ